MAALAGCGGSSTSYNEAAFRSCLEDKGATTLTISEVSLAERRQRAPSVPWDGIDRYMPGAWLAVFSGEQPSVFYFGPKSKLEAARHWVKDIRQSDSDASIEGNFLVFTEQHPTAGMKSSIDACKSDAKRT